MTVAAAGALMHAKSLPGRAATARAASPLEATPITAHALGARGHFRTHTPLGGRLGCADRQAVEPQSPVLVQECGVDEPVPGHEPLVGKGL